MALLELKTLLKIAEWNLESVCKSNFLNFHVSFFNFFFTSYK